VTPTSSQRGINFLEVATSLHLHHLFFLLLSVEHELLLHDQEAHVIPEWVVSSVRNKLWTSVEQDVDPGTTPSSPYANS
jgi:hypothetical protein